LLRSMRASITNGEFDRWAEEFYNKYKLNHQVS